MIPVQILSRYLRFEQLFEVELLNYQIYIN